MTTPRIPIYSFLGECGAPHFAAVADIVARAAGFESGLLDEPGLARLDEIAAAPGPALVYLCGLPYVRLRDAGAPVEALAAPVPRGEPGPQYFADLLVRDGLEASSAADLAGRRVGFNGRDSLSGFVLPYRALADRGLAAPLYDGAIETGSHRRSLALLVEGEIDAAAIDSTLLALEARANPAVAALRVLERLGPAPIPPVVLKGGDPALAGRVREALVSLDRHEAGRRVLELGLMQRYVEVSDADYDPVREMDAAVS
jgi:ABC-type phosphate/phosphonate transport system substrate-binding protein